MELKLEVENNTDFDDAIKARLYRGEDGITRVREDEEHVVANLMMQKHGVISTNEDGIVKIHNHALNKTFLASSPGEALDQMVNMLGWELPGVKIGTKRELELQHLENESDRVIEMLSQGIVPSDEDMIKHGFVYDDDQEAWILSETSGPQGMHPATRDDGVDWTDPDDLNAAAADLLVKELDLTDEQLEAGFLSEDMDR